VILSARCMFAAYRSTIATIANLAFLKRRSGNG
jgi:hypothetical protein